MRINYRKDNSGITLIEAIIVTGIMGVLVTMAAVSYAHFERMAEEDACRDNVQSIQKQLQVFKLQHGRYPTDFDAFLENKKYFNTKPVCSSDRAESTGYNYEEPTGAAKPIVTCATPGHGD